MSDIPPIKGTASPPGATPQRRAEGARNVGGDTARAAPVADRVEISEMGQLLSTLELDPDVRVDKVMEIRQAILNGTYDTEAKLDYAIGRLLAVVRSRE